MVAYQLQDIRFVVYQKDLYVGIRHVKNVLVRLSGSKVKKMETHPRGGARLFTKILICLYTAVTSPPGTYSKSLRKASALSSAARISSASSGVLSLYPR